MVNIQASPRSGKENPSSSGRPEEKLKVYEKLMAKKWDNQDGSFNVELKEQVLVRDHPTRRTGYAARYRNKVSSSKQPNDMRGVGDYPDGGWSIRVASSKQPNDMRGAVDYPEEGLSIRVVSLKQPTDVPGAADYPIATDYFTKWVEAVLLKNVTQKEVIEFLLNYIIYRFGIPHTLTTDQGLMFTGKKFIEFFTEFNVKLHHSSPYYPQANGLAEAANKIVIGIIRKMVEGNPRKWHTLLPQALWAHRNSRNTSTGFSPYQLTFG
ncbi:uncharacterized protein LOC127242029 [Andrographis paniculata]|uniref:uncharacterized protein LOC127242029 n=1 Tax=Andrographis paniculata TaxID=175694 RepID=UPI0021E713FC|nr:uncharacterized protein LOC127242029 [Andrographis paniculata]